MSGSRQNEAVSLTMVPFEFLETRRLAAADVALALELADPALQTLQAEHAVIGQACSSIAVPRVVHERAEGNAAQLDVDQDGYLTYSDVEAVLQQLRQVEPAGPQLAKPQLAEGEDAFDDMHFDVTQDGRITPLDALVVLNRVHFYNSLVPCSCGQCLANAVVDGIPGENRLTNRC